MDGKVNDDWQCTNLFLDMLQNAINVEIKAWAMVTKHAGRHPHAMYVEIGLLAVAGGGNHHPAAHVPGVPISAEDCHRIARGHLSERTQEADAELRELSRSLNTMAYKMGNKLNKTAGQGPEKQLRPCRHRLPFFTTHWMPLQLAETDNQAR